MTELSPSIPDVVKQQLPAYVNTVENEKFIALLKHYYGWLTQNGQPTDFIHNILSYRDIDLTNPAFRSHLTASLLDIIPDYSKADKTLLTKHIADFVKSKGNFESFYYIMNSIYGENIEVEWNSNKLFRPSANEYYRDASVVIESSAPWINVLGSELVQTYPSPASAIIIGITSNVFDGTQLNWLTLDDKSLSGEFSADGKVEVLRNNVNRSWYREEEYYQYVSFVENKIEFLATSEKERPYVNLIVRQIGSTFRATVSSFISRVQETSRTRVKLGLTGVTGTLNSNDLYIVSSALENSLILKSDYESGVVSSSIVDVQIDNRGASYITGDTVSFYGGDGELASGFVSEVTSSGINDVFVVNNGYGYSVGDRLTTIDTDTGGSGAIAEVSQIDGINGAIGTVAELNSAVISQSGSGYAVNDELEIHGGTSLAGTPPARIKVLSVNSTWLFKGVQINNIGREYPPYTKLELVNTVTKTIVTGFAATPTFGIDGSITAVNVTSIPTIATSDLAIVANGYGADANGNIVGGAITSYTMVTGGVNYKNPMVYIQGDGIGAIALPVMSAGVITGVNVVKTGSGYTTATVIITEHDGSGFDASALIQDQVAGTGSIVTFSILNRGQYNRLPSCFNTTLVARIGTGVGASLNTDYRLLSAFVESSGHHYSAISTLVQGNGTGTSLRGDIQDGVITSFNKISGGSGYTYAHIFVSGGVGFVGTASIVGGAVNAIVILDGGFGYSTGSVVSIVGDGIGASFDLLGGGNISNGVLKTVTVIDGGINYFYGTTVSCPVTQVGAVPATLTPIIVDGVIKNVSSTGGSGYITSDLANITINNGTTATLTTTVGGIGGIVGHNTINGGYGFYSQSEVPQLLITTAVAGTGAKFLPTINDAGEIVKVDVIDGGSGYTLSSTISVSGGGGTGAILSLVVFNGRVTDVLILSCGTGYKYGTYAIILGDGIGAAITPIVETGITSADVVDGGSGYTSDTVINITDPTGTGAEIRPVIVNGIITSLNIINKGIGYTNPTLVATIGTSANLIAIAKRNISDLNITSKGSGYTYANLVIVGDGHDTEFLLTFEELGSIDSSSVLLAGTGYTSDITVVVTDPSAYGAVSAVKVIENGAGYKKHPILTLPKKYDNLGFLIADGAKFSCFGDDIGSVRKVLFYNHGARYKNLPTPVFSLVATIDKSAAFRVGEEVTLLSGRYKDVASTNYTLMENTDRILLEDDSLLVLDKDISFFDIAPTAKVSNFDYDRSTIHLDMMRNITMICTETGQEIQTENNIDIVDDYSSSFEDGDIIVGTNSGSRATLNLVHRASGTAIRGGNAWTGFKFKDDTGMLNNKLSVIADNQKYQDYAYVIKAGIALSEYENLIRKTVHPAGFSLFGDVKTKDENINVLAIETDILNVIGYNEIVAIVYLITTAFEFASAVEEAQSGVDWNNLTDFYGDYTKFQFQTMPIELVKNYTIHQTSDRIHSVIDEYPTVPLNSLNLTTWTHVNNASVVVSANKSHDSVFPLYLVGDPLNTLSEITTTVACTIGDTISFEFFISKNVSALTYPKISIGNDFINFNLATGAYTESVAGVIMDVNQMTDYFYVRIKTVAIASSISAAITPSAGFVSAFGIDDATATGSFEISDCIVKNITALTPSPMVISAYNSLYLPSRWNLLGTDGHINSI